MDENTVQEQNGVCESVIVHDKVAGDCEIDGYTTATPKGRVLHYSLYKCPNCGYQWAYYFDVDANKLEKISVGEFQRCRHYI